MFCLATLSLWHNVKKYAAQKIRIKKKHVNKQYSIKKDRKPYIKRDQKRMHKPLCCQESQRVASISIPSMPARVGIDAIGYPLTVPPSWCTTVSGIAPSLVVNYSHQITHLLSPFQLFPSPKLHLSLSGTEWRQNRSRILINEGEMQLYLCCESKHLNIWSAYAAQIPPLVTCQMLVLCPRHPLTWQSWKMQSLGVFDRLHATRRPHSNPQWWNIRGFLIAFQEGNLIEAL